MKIALAMIIKPSDDEADLLSRCLEHTAPYVDGIYITVTGHNDRVTQVAKLFGAEVSYCEWNNNFAEARNFNFSQVPKDYDYIFWLDADDVPRGVEKLKETIEKHPSDTYSMYYLYAFDEHNNPNIVHLKTRVIKNDGCVEWAGRLHEDFREVRGVNRYLIEGIEILHLSNNERFARAKDRNLEVALAQLRESPDDPRSFWNVANSYKAMAKNDEALEFYDRFLLTSNSEDEKYIAKLRVSETYWQMGQKAKAIEYAQTAIGLKPNYPDAYFLLGSLYFETQKLEKAQEMYLTGLMKPKPYHKIIVYNPRDYDYVPMMNLAKVYFAMSRPDLSVPLLEGCLKIQPKDKNLKKIIKEMKKEQDKFDKVVGWVAKLKKIKDKDKLKEAFDKIPQELQSHPAVCNLRNTNFIKETSFGRDMVIFCGYTSEFWTPKSAKEKGIGGSEEAVIWLSNIFAKNGWNVTVYNQCGHEVQEFDGVTYKPFWMWNHRDKQDVTILWRTPRYADYNINTTKLFVDMHDVYPAEEFTEARMKLIDKVFVKSKYQRELFPNIPDDKIVVIPNGIDPSRFVNTDRDNKLVVNTSAPNRGLSIMPYIVRRVREKVPDAKFQWAYGWSVFDAGFEGNVKVAEWKDKLRAELKDSGVEELGRLSHEEVADLYLKANIWCYPSGFAEIDCISLSKAMAAGAIPVTTDFAALAEKQGHGGFFYSSERTDENWKKPDNHDFSIVDPEQIDAIAQKVIELLENPPSEESRQEMRQWARETYAWGKIAIKWLNEINE